MCKEIGRLTCQYNNIISNANMRSNYLFEIQEISLKCKLNNLLYFEKSLIRTEEEYISLLVDQNEVSINLYLRSMQQLRRSMKKRTPKYS